uniref:Uncharacterized protein n=1 Tax=Myoviridae sp. ctk6V34 TaxID=2825164 RepID=A0A8S5V3N1_9CAUD|nr:MAG TPA: hypothetical protein [Myoviridae sp. ctk6V34]
MITQYLDRYIFSSQNQRYSLYTPFLNKFRESSKKSIDKIEKSLYNVLRI